MTGKTEPDEPLPVELPCRMFQNCNPPLVILDQIVVGGEDVRDAKLSVHRRAQERETLKHPLPQGLHGRSNCHLCEISSLTGHHVIEIISINTTEVCDGVDSLVQVEWSVIVPWDELRTLTGHNHRLSIEKESIATLDVLRAVEERVLAAGYCILLV